MHVFVHCLITLSYVYYYSVPDCINALYERNISDHFFNKHGWRISKEENLCFVVGVIFL